MSKIEELIMQLCPDGVAFKTLGETCEIKTGKGITKNQGNEKAVYPIISGGKDPMGYFDNYNRLENTVTVSRVGANAGFVNFINTKFYLNDKCFSILPTVKFEKQIESKFLFYFLKSNESVITGLQSEGGVPTINTTKISGIQIPIPPLAIQEEIVNILDTFTTLEAELEAELEARKKQYTFYRDSLLSFEGKDVEWKTLGEVASYSKNRISANQLNENNYIGVDNLLQDRRGKTSSSYVPTAGNLTEFIAGDVLIGNIRPYLKKIWHSNIRGGTNGDVLTLRINANHSNEFSSKFLYYLLASDKFFDFNMQFAKGAKMPRGDKDAILRFPIPYPSKSVQKNVVKILDKFDVLVNDISIGLPAELAARRKQYEYYRNQLLTFNNVSNE
jgi:type I restriction enzyme S subunit